MSDLRKKIINILSQKKRVTIKDPNRISAAVLVPLFLKGGEECLLFTKRSETVETHKGQISFPGGVKDERDLNFTETALRESYEEVGLLREDIDILGALDDMATTTTNYIIYPLIGIIPWPYNFKINYEEIDKLLEVPVSNLLDKNNFIEDRNYLYRGKLYHYTAFKYGEHHIWGTTARIVKRFLRLFYGWDLDQVDFD